MQKLMIAAFAFALTALPAAAQTTRAAPKASSYSMRGDAGSPVSTDDTTAGTGHNSSFDTANDVGTGNTVGGKKVRSDNGTKDRNGVDDAEINDYERSTATERGSGPAKTMKPKKESKVLAPDDQYQRGGSLPPSTPSTPSSTPLQ